MKSFARLLPVPGVSQKGFGLVASCLLAAASLASACTPAEGSSRANNPSGSTHGESKKAGDGDPGDDGPISNPSQPPKATGNPLEGVKLWVDPNSNAMLRANSIRA